MLIFVGIYLICLGIIIYKVNQDYDLPRHICSPPDEYTLEDWEREMRMGMTLECPWCHRSDEYAPRKYQDRKYRACKACGIFQNVGEEKQQARIAHCDCGYGAWTLNPIGKKCDRCGKYNKIK